MSFCIYVAWVAITNLVNWMPAPTEEFQAYAKRGKCFEECGIRAGGQSYSIAIGSIGDELAYFVIQATPLGKDSFIPVAPGSSYNIEPDGSLVMNAVTACLQLPDGKTVPLPLKNQLIEIKDGKVRISDRRLTLAEVKAYVDSKPKGYSLDNLFQFVDAKRKQPNK